LSEAKSTPPSPARRTFDPRLLEGAIPRALFLLAGYLVIAAGIIALLVNAWTGGIAPLQHLPNEFWQDLGMWAVVQGMSIGIVILMAAAAAGIGRSLAFAMAASLAFFPVDNFSVILEALGSRITKQDHPWLNISQYQLGPNLNAALSLIAAFLYWAQLQAYRQFAPFNLLTLAYAKALEKLTGVDVGKMLPIPDISNKRFPEAAQPVSPRADGGIFRHLLPKLEADKRRDESLGARTAAPPDKRNTAPEIAPVNDAFFEFDDVDIDLELDAVHDLAAAIILHQSLRFQDGHPRSS